MLCGTASGFVTWQVALRSAPGETLLPPSKALLVMKPSDNAQVTQEVHRRADMQETWRQQRNCLRVTQR